MMRVGVLVSTLLSLPWATARFFTPGEEFACNEGIATKPCSSWASQLIDTSTEVIIPCGTCVEITESTDITLPEGIDIQGRLRLAPLKGDKITIRTSSVLVQGILSIDTPYAPSVDETVNFIMMDKGADFHFNGVEDNRNICTPTHVCNVGRRPIAVAGGRLDIKGLPDTCATWKQLQRVSTSTKSISSAPVFKEPKDNCSVVLLDENFDGVANLWAPYNNAWVYIRNDNKGTYLEARNRHTNWQGIARHLDDSFMSCVEAGIPYLVTFSMKITGANGADSLCTSTGEKCPYIGFRRKTTSKSDESRQEITRTNKGALPHDDAWLPISGIVTFAEEDLVAEPYYRFIYIDGPNAGESFAIDSFQIKRADSSFFRTNACSELITNGDAELDQTSSHPYPVYAADRYRTALTVQKENNNQFFHVSGRQYNWATLRVDISQDCLSQEEEYTFSLKARSTVAFKYETRLAFFTKTADNGRDKWNSISISRDCYTGENEWTTCTGSVTLSNPLIFEAHRVFVDVRNLEAAFNNVDMDFDDLSFEFKTGSVGGFIVDASGVKDCWAPGSKVLLTSDTIHFEDDTNATIASVQDQGDGTVQLTFEEVLSPRSSTEDGFPIEIALLERNVKFESDNHAVHNQGGHLIVYHTQDVAQVIDGVELYKFGQRGNMGRYPLHLHMCSFIKNETYIKRNLISHSNQRCSVIHGTHGANVEDNVAYHNFGHCYMLEDGGEINNRFVGNLAAAQHRTEDSNLLRESESDNRPSAFWISNPMNTFIGNVAAGGEGSGFWLELEREVKAPSIAVVDGRLNELELTEFRDNIAHSHRSHGLRTYPSGYRPKKRAVFENTRSFKNRGNGVFFHNSWNLKVSGGVFADNRRQIQIHRADDVHIEDVDIIGQTKSYVDAQNRAGSRGQCPSSSSQYGITIHSFLFSSNSLAGPSLKNIRFYNLSDTVTGCPNTAAIEIHDDEVESYFDSWTRFENLQFGQSFDGTRFSMCDAVNEGLGDVLIEVIGGDTGDGFITSKDQDELTAFLPANSCTEAEGVDCALFCAGACLRTLRFLVDPYAGEGLVLEVSSAGVVLELTDGGTTADDITRASTYRVFSTALPPGSYSMKFLKDGKETWPGFALEDLVEPPTCWSDSNLTYTLSKPSSICDVLVSETTKNGDFESGSLQYWQHMWSGVSLATPGEGGNGFAGISPMKARSNMGQHIDTRCMVEGDEYEFKARVRSMDSADGGSALSCDPNSNTVGVRCSYATIYSEFTDAEGSKDKSYTRIARTVASTTDEDWKTIHGVFAVTQHMAESDRVFFYVEGGPGYVQVDNVSLTKFDRNGTALILNGDFESGDHQYWTRGWNDGLEMTTGTDDGNAVTTTQNYKSIQQYLGPGALEAGKRYLFEAKFKIDGGTGTCEPETWWGTNACPKVWVDARFSNNTFNKNHGYQLAVPPYVPEAWNVLYGYIDTTTKMVEADTVRLYVGNGPKQSKIVLDDVSLEEVERNCNELVINGDAETKDARGWRRYGPTKLNISQDANTGLYSIANLNRDYSWAGLEQLVDTSCMELGRTYMITASIKLVKDGEPFDCGAANRCPRAHVESRFDPRDIPHQRVYLTNENTDWKASSYNQYAASFTVDDNMATADNVAIVFRNPPAFVDMLLDDISFALI